MPAVLNCPSDFSLSATEVAGLWQKTIALRSSSDDQVNVACVSEQEIARLNEQYRSSARPTNVLTFSYPPVEGEGAEHDVSLCLAVAKREAEQRKVALRDYTALLLVHAFLHATGLDHEASEAAAEQTRQAERTILDQTSFNPTSLQGDI